MVRLTLRSKVLVIMAIPVAVLVAATFALLAASRDSADALIAERQAASLRGAYEDVLVDMTDTESATRGYVLTGERSFLEPYDLAVERLPAHMRTLTELTRDSASAAAVVVELRARVNQRLSLLQTMQLLAPINDVTNHDQLAGLTPDRPAAIRDPCDRETGSSHRKFSHICRRRRGRSAGWSARRDGAETP